MVERYWHRNPRQRSQSLSLLLYSFSGYFMLQLGLLIGFPTLSSFKRLTLIIDTESTLLFTNLVSHSIPHDSMSSYTISSLFLNLKVMKKTTKKKTRSNTRSNPTTTLLLLILSPPLQTRTQKSLLCKTLLSRHLQHLIARTLYPPPPSSRLAPVSRGLAHQSRSSPTSL